ncbi:MAG: DUF4258 domain-containing protein [Sulfuricellaceae bacterium]
MDQPPALKLDWVCKQIRIGRYYWSYHGDQERQADNLTIAEVENAIECGRVIECYPDTGRGESCLIAGFSDGGIPIHAVVGIRGGLPVIVTTYIPKPPKFKTPYERG